MRIAVLGATGAVGRTMLAVLEASPLDVREVRPLASEASRGRTIRWRGKDWTVGVPGPGTFEGCDVALFSAGAERSREWAPRAAEEGATVIDNSSAWRMDPEVPLIVPEVNGHRAAEAARTALRRAISGGKIRGITEGAEHLFLTCLQKVTCILRLLLFPRKATSEGAVLN
jgi:aspartate-semialdehyde dehydrogenase